MKTANRYITILLLICVHAKLIAQPPADVPFHKYADTISARFSSSAPYYIIQWEKSIPAGITIIRQLDQHTAIIELPDQKAFDSLKNHSRLAIARNEWKLSPFAARLNETDAGEEQYILSARDLDALLPALKNVAGYCRVLFTDRSAHTVLVKATTAFVRSALLPLPEVIFADIRAVPHSEIAIIGYNRSFHGLNAMDHEIPGANGKNITVGVKERRMEESDLDLVKRVMPSTLASPQISNHATVISSIIGGAGNSFYDGRGIANRCHFFPSSFDNLFADDAAALNAGNVSVQNNSYGTVVQSFYGAEALSYDVQAWQNKNRVFVFSAGNQGNAATTEGQYKNIAGFANLTGNFKMAKNVITVGAIDNKSSIPPESSAGPLYDGRLAPQVTALGPNGTSDAAAVVTGVVAVMQQVYADSNNQALPAASLVKAILYNSAADIHNKGIDYKTGYGLLNGIASINAIRQKEYDGGTVSPAQVWTKTVIVPANAAQLKVTLAWTDSAASLNNFRSLINDLDLEVRDNTSGIVYKPWVLNSFPHGDSLAKAPERKRDSLNTAEQVSLQLPVAGEYDIIVKAVSVATAALPFHVAYHSDTLNTFHFTSPQHASDIAPEESANADIRWTTFVADTNLTGNLYVSYNRGINWQLLKANHKLYTLYYPWPVKDTGSTAQLKMETAFGSFLSKEFIISKTVRPRIDFFCADSLRLSWQKHVYATAYKLYTLADSAYLKHVLTLTDTFAVLNRLQFPSFVYAVQPVLSNDLPAARSIAMDIRFQGTACFYKTFYHNLQALNKLELVLELSAPEYADSLFFYQVSAAGQPIRKTGAVSVSGSNRLYHSFADEIPAGTSYWRAGIKLKNGSVVHTEIISVLASGRRFIVFYPNPTRRTQLLHYVTQQDLPANTRLQLYDIQGRLLKKFTEMPGSIDLSAMTAGVVIYKLISHTANVLETGKLLVY